MQSEQSTRVAQQNISDRICGGYYRAEYYPCRRRGKFCYRHYCKNPKCRDRARWSVKKRIEIGLAETHAKGDRSYLITIGLLDTQQKTNEFSVTEALKKNIQKLRARFVARLRRLGYTVDWWLVWGQKNGPVYQLHAHLVISVDGQLDDRCHRKLFTWLKNLARQLGLQFHIEPVTNPKGLANYLAYKNLGELDKIQLPPGFQRFQTSRCAPKLNWQIQRAARRKEKKALVNALDQPRPAPNATRINPRKWHGIRFLRSFPKFATTEHPLNKPFAILFSKHRNILCTISQEFSSAVATHIQPNLNFNKHIAGIWRKIRHEIRWLNLLCNIGPR